ncbi:hypothetical protein [Rhodococcus rhodochrous]|uniref:Transmembrane protein n=1 Tax=Rhodococcus rhodochrous KG-21 TaxID=1441923 RepID=A0A0M8PLU1_RHORH|nr:hypothetical protein [Rhodococcus rhodochrous]KOS57565.1 hypothetical protein Z051_03535 [Rhodococcus rhodochrous KG-21]
MIDTDDLLYRVDSHYLGPTGKTMPIRIRYTAAGLGVALFAAVFVTARAIVHAPLSFKSLVVMVALTVVLTSKITRHVGPDRPVRSVLRAAWNDLTAPRPPKPGHAVTVPLPPRTTTLSTDGWPEAVFATGTDRDDAGDNESEKR